MANKMSNKLTLGSNTAEKMMSKYSSGMALQISMKRCINKSTLPAKKPCSAPVSTPMTVPSTVSVREPNSCVPSGIATSGVPLAMSMNWL